MTQREFDQKVAIILERGLERLQARVAKYYSALRGEAQVKRVKRKGYWVRRHYVKPHTFTLIRSPREPERQAASRQPRRKARR